MRTYPFIGLSTPEVLLPRAGVSLNQWAVVACDQYTSEPEYWAEVDAQVGDAPSTLRLIYPEVYLEHGDDDEAARIAAINASMRAYLEQDLLTPRDGMILVERQIGEHTRRGLVVCVDLEAYDFREGSTSLIRATEGTIVERLPPRIKVREGAPLELPHIMVLIDDPEATVIEPLAAARDALEVVYDFELMKGGGRLEGRLVSEDHERRAVEALTRLADPAGFQARYSLDEETPVLLHAMGDGNHSLATAKTIWERYKSAHANASDVELQNSPLRHALVELVNVHDPALTFEPIHRVLFGLQASLVDALRDAFGERLTVEPSPSVEALVAWVESSDATGHRAGLLQADALLAVEVHAPRANLSVGTYQAVLDGFMADGGAQSVDYVHGLDVVERLGRRPENIGVYLPGMRKDELFRTVILDGVLPRKAFSLGEAHEKRFYMECRRL